MNGRYDLRLEIVSGRHRLLDLATQWRSLYAAAPTPDPSLRWEWQSTWWRLFGPAGLRAREAKIAAIWQGSDLVGLLPMYVEKLPGGAARLRLMSCSSAEDAEGVYPEYLDVLCRPSYEDQVIEALAALFRARNVLAWDILIFERFAQTSLLARLSRRLGVFPRFKRSASAIAPQSDLSGGFDAYLASRSSNARSRFRRLLRSCGSRGLDFRAAQTADEMQRFFRELAELHQTRWNDNGRRGAFHSPRLRLFHETLIQQLKPGREVLITRLADARGPLALIYGFISGAKFDFYQCGVRYNEAPVASPGILAHLLTMKMLAERGIAVYDFLAGVSDYKLQLATRSETLLDISIYRPSLPAVAAAGHSLVKRAVRFETVLGNAVKAKDYVQAYAPWKQQITESRDFPEASQTGKPIGGRCSRFY